MSSFHAFAVHAPIGLSLLAPFVCALLTFLILRRGVDKRAWWVAVLVAVSIAIGSFVASSSGDTERHVLREGVPAAALDEHEAAGNWVVISSCVFSLACLVGALDRNEKRRKIVMIASIVLACHVASTTIRTGYLGGKLVYEHNAAAFRHD